MAVVQEVVLLLLAGFVTGDIVVHSPFPNDDDYVITVLADYPDAAAAFGPFISAKGIKAWAIAAFPEDGCSALEPPPDVYNPTMHWAVVIRRYNCSFEEKVFFAQKAGYQMAIVHNVNSSKLEIMHANDPDRIYIPSVFVGESAGLELKTKYSYTTGAVLFIDEDSIDFNAKMLIPFLLIVLACFLLLVGFVVARCIKDYRRARRRRMPYSSLSRIPTAKYRKGDPHETCVICLDDFVEGEKLRVLPCSHAYHCKCIDPWLTRNRRVCPMCKRKVFARDETVDSDDDLSSEEEGRTPLLGNVPTRSQGGTFSNQLPWSPADEANRRLRVLRALGLLDENEVSDSASGSASGNHSLHSDEVNPFADQIHEEAPHSQTENAPQAGNGTPSDEFHTDASSLGSLVV